MSSHFEGVQEEALRYGSIIAKLSFSQSGPMCSLENRFNGVKTEEIEEPPISGGSSRANNALCSSRDT